MQRNCAECGAVIPPQQGSARPRKFCTTCRPPRNRANPRVIQLPDREQEQPKATRPARPAAQRPAVPPLVASYAARLVVAERLDTPEGAHVMYLAELFAAGGHTAAGAAALSRELRAAMELALKDAPREADKLDELAERRAAKAAGAS